MTAVYVTIYRKILLICPEHIYEQRTNLMGGGGGGGLIFKRKNTSICNLLNLFLFLFSRIKDVFQHFLCHARCTICSKLTKKTPYYLKLTKLKINTLLTLLWPLYLTLNTFHFLLQHFYC